MSEQTLVYEEKMKKTLAKNLQICYAGIWRSRVQESTGMAS